MKEFCLEVPMAEKEFNNQDASARQVPQNAPPSGQKKQSRALWILLLVFFAFVATVFLTQHRDTIDWVEDYEAGIKLAKQQNKPVLLAFYKQFTPMSTDTFQNTYNNPDVIKYVEANFIPILIDVDKHPEIAKRYNIGYYPTHYVRQPDSDQLFGPRLGYDPPGLFIVEMKNLLKKMELSGE